MVSSLLLGKTISCTQTNKKLTQDIHTRFGHTFDWIIDILLILPTECAPLCMK